MPKFDDELNDLPIATKTVATTATAVAPAKAPVGDLEDGEVPTHKPPSKTAATVDEADDVVDVEFGDSKLMAKGDGLNRIRAEKNKTVRFAILPYITPKSAHSHFVDTKDKKGTFRCLTAKDEETPFCCAKLGEEGMLHVVSLAIQYTNADPKDGTYVKGTPIEWEIGYVDLSRSNYRAVSNLAPEDSSVYDIDIAMSKKDSGIGYEFVLRAVKARWKLNPELAAEVEAAAQKFVKDGGKKLIGKLGRKLDLVGWRALLSGQATSSAEASLEDIGDL
jgi:hypothetical protein